MICNWFDILDFLADEGLPPPTVVFFDQEDRAISLKWVLWATDDEWFTEFRTVYDPDEKLLTHHYHAWCNHEHEVMTFEAWIKKFTDYTETLHLEGHSYEPRDGFFGILEQMGIGDGSNS